MSDLVRGRGQAAPPPAPDPATAPPPAETPAPPAETPPVRLASRTPARPTPPAPATPRPAARPEAPVAKKAAPDAAKPVTRGAPTEAVEQLFAELQRFLARVGDLIDKGVSFPWAELERLIGHALESLEASGELFWVANRPAPAEGADQLAFHQARVAVLAMRVGANVGLERPRLVELGVAGSLIDVALWQLSPALARRPGALSSEEQSQYRAHPRLGAELIQRWSPPFEGVVEMVLQHHEREQGQGFPQGLTGAAIRPDAKILGLVDTYAGLTALGSLKSGLQSHEAIRDIVRSKRESFPPLLIKALLSEISVFPPGTVVRLNTGEVGRVIAVNRNHPLRPRIEVFDAKGQRLAAPKMIDLSEAPFLYITGPVSESAR
ncbi:MAG TPA: HD domain-containing phosphohydrolase [Methylomirabilota bacterium]|nr:HD domain-containing phosphohydrolase [Methylomirabilota bacterium]